MRGCRFKRAHRYELAGAHVAVVMPEVGHGLHGHEHRAHV
jgi:hypothetical protein